MQCMKFLDQNNECMQECYECQDEHQEHYEDHDEHQEHIFEKFLMQRKHARHQTQKSFMFRLYGCKNAHVKQEKMQNKKTSRSNKKTYQEQLEDHEEHYECMNFRKKARCTCN